MVDVHQRVATGPRVPLRDPLPAQPSPAMSRPSPVPTTKPGGPSRPPSGPEVLEEMTLITPAHFLPFLPPLHYDPVGLGQDPEIRVSILCLSHSFTKDFLSTYHVPGTARHRVHSSDQVRQGSWGACCGVPLRSCLLELGHLFSQLRPQSLVPSQ